MPFSEIAAEGVAEDVALNKVKAFAVLVRKSTTKADFTVSDVSLKLGSPMSPRQQRPDVGFAEMVLRNGNRKGCGPRAFPG